MPNLSTRKPLSTEEQKTLFLAIEELRARGKEIPLEVSKHLEDKRRAVWPVDPNGYFVRDDGWRYDPSENHRNFVHSTSRFSALWGPRGCGKALDISTPIPTPYGWKMMADIQAGDWVFDETGTPVEVVETSETMFNHKCYDVVFDDGSVITADAEHIWTTLTAWDRANKDSDGKWRIKRGKLIRRHVGDWGYRDFTTEEIKDTLTTGYRNDVNHSVDVSLPINLPEADLPIPPYVLGLWLGDGKSNGSNITIGDEDIDVQHEILSEFGVSLKSYGKIQYGMVLNGENSHVRNLQTGRIESNPNSLYSHLKKYNLLNNKHIPQEYLRASYSQRLELMQGLMDSDGHIKPDGHCEFSVTSRPLAEGFYELCGTLGIKVSMKEGVVRFAGRDFGRFRFIFTPYIPIFRLPRKLNRIKQRGNQSNRQFRRYIVNVVEAHSVPVKCITVDSDNHLYLAGFSFIPTHNSGSGAQKALRKIMLGESGAIMNPDMENFKVSTWPEFKRWIPWEMVVPGQRNRRRPEWEPTRPFTMVFMNGAKVICKGLKNSDSARGPNINWLWYDEAGRDKEGEGWKLAVASVRVGKNPQAWATYTPKHSEHWTTKFFRDKKIPEEAKELFALAVGEDKILIDSYHATRKDNEKNLDAGFYASVLTVNTSGYLKAQEYDGEVADEGGQIGYREWFDNRIVVSLPTKVIKVVRAWDTAGTEKKSAKDDPDQSVGSKIIKFKPSENPEWLASYEQFIPETLRNKFHFIIENQVSGYWIWERLVDVIKNTAKWDGPYVEVLIDQDPGGAGKNQVAAIAQAFKDKSVPELNSHTVSAVDVKKVGDRVLAANTHWFGAAAEGRMWLMKGGWNDAFLGQLDGFTMIEHDDLITSVTSGMWKLNPALRWSKVPFVSV